MSGSRGCRLAAAENKMVSRRVALEKVGFSACALE